MDCYTMALNLCIVLYVHDVYVCVCAIVQMMCVCVCMWAGEGDLIQNFL